MKSPQLWHFGQAHLAYSNQIAKQRGAIESPQCDVAPGYSRLDHDQRSTLEVGFYAALPWYSYASFNSNYGSGFTSGNPNDQYPGNYLPPRTAIDLSVGKRFGERTTLVVTGLNLANTRVLVDNSLTFGGFHYSDPRQIYAEVRYPFKH